MRSLVEQPSNPPPQWEGGFFFSKPIIPFDATFAGGQTDTEVFWERVGSMLGDIGSTLLIIIDFLLRLAGIGLALAVMVGFVITPLNWIKLAWNSNPHPVARLLHRIWMILMAGLFYVAGWRMMRFFGGYVGSSEYPFHFVVRWIGG
jgi:hypothetical protein